MRYLTDGKRKIAALGLFGAMALAILAAGIARVAETPAAGASGKLGRIAPGDLGIVRFELAKIGVSRTEIDDRVAREALAGMPLAGDPFTALAANRLLVDPAGKNGVEAKLLAEALRRDPRSRAARILMMRQMAANGDLEGAFDQLAVFNRLNPGLVATIMEAITTRVTTPGQVDDALAAIEGHDSLYAPFVMRMSAKAKPAEVVLRLAERLPEGVMARSEIKQAMVAQLVKVGEYTVARNLWQRGNAAGASGLVHSPDFADGRSPPPFNWQLYVGSTGAAEKIAGGIGISYYDRSPGLLLTQLVTLPAGQYRATADYEIIDGMADNVRLRVVCQGTETVLAEGRLVARKPGTNRLALNLAVPAVGCPAQVLAVVGVASEERGETQLLIRRIDVAAMGGSAP